MSALSPRLLFMGRVFLQTILVAFGCGGGIVTIHDIYYYSLPLLATNTSIVKYTNRKACLCTINFVSAHSYGSISFMGTVFLLKFGPSNYSAPFTVRLKIVPNSRQRSSRIYAINGNRMRTQTES